MANYDGDVFDASGQLGTSALKTGRAGDEKPLGDSGGGGATTYYRMRALANPGPGYETWTATTEDFAGAGAAGPIQAGTAVVVISW